jgi:Transmembrane secretion effector
VNRQKFVCVINLWLAAITAGLAVLGWLHLLNPYTILASVFLVGVGFAFNAPAWTSIAPSSLRPRAPVGSDLKRFATQYFGNYRSGIRWFLGPVRRSEFCIAPPA